MDHPHYHYEAYVGPKRWNIRINDFPDENIFTLFVNDKPVLDFNRWPHKHWADEPVEALEKIAESKGY